jgi:type I restriction-modification system DNA methylase subunit
MSCPDSIRQLIEKFSEQAQQYRSADYNETQLRIDFINPMFKALGWDMDNIAGYAEPYRDVVHEDAIRIEGNTKAPDYSFRIGGVRKFFLEAKRPSVNIKDSVEAAYQLRRYAWTAKLPLSILTDFEEFAVYDTRKQPKHLDKASNARVSYFTYQQYIDRWDEIVAVFSKEAILKGAFDRYVESKGKGGTSEFDNEFLREIEDWRKKLAQSLALRNDTLLEGDLNFAVQRIIDRIIFLRICEARGTERFGQLQALLSGEQTYARLLTLFRSADDRYNSGLFHFNPERDRHEQPDELTPMLEVEDQSLKAIIRRLYYPESPYAFSAVAPDILGNVYERFLGSVIELTPAHRAKIEPKPEVRKAGGVYYTPTYIVDYIVRSIAEKLLDGKTPKDAAKLKFVDPACGSGSFLLGAYQFLLDWHHNWYLKDGVEKWLKGKGATLRPGPGAQAVLTSKERKRILLANIYGVDIDYQAVEVTKLALLLKVLEGETTESVDALSRLFRERALPDLGDNIKCGNSLIGPDVYETELGKHLTPAEKNKINAFDWKSEFVDVFKQGGFDAVIGNPPYGALAQEAEAIYFRKNYGTLANSLDSFIMFIERSAALLKINGRVGFIVPSGWVSAPSARSLRQYFLKHYIPESFVSLPFDVFAGAYIDTVIFTAKRKLTVAEAPSGLPLELVVFPHRYKITDISDFEKYRKFGNTKGWMNAAGEEFLIVSSTAESELLQKIRRQPTNFDNYIVLKRGIETYALREKSDGVKNATLAFDGVLQRYVLEPEKPKYLNYSREIRESKPWEFFSYPRILLRQVLSRKLRMQATFTEDAFLTNQSVQSLILRVQSKSPFLLHWLLGILNSRLLSWYFVNFNSVARRDDFPKIIIKQTRELPIPSFESATKGKRLGALVELMLSLHKSSSLVKTPHKQEALRREIEGTDRRIDALVYELYGLSEKEIRLVEAGIG